MFNPYASHRRKPANRTGRDADPTRTIKLNTAAWQRLRADVLRTEPLCRHCAAMGLTVPATDVDHMNGASDNRRQSLQPLCHECHSRKTGLERAGLFAGVFGADGCPASGAHHWLSK